jgi:hypothetical protein
MMQKPRQSRRSACDRCRSYKLRCERSSLDAGTGDCERCIRSSASCTTTTVATGGLERSQSAAQQELHTGHCARTARPSSGRDSFPRGQLARHSSELQRTMTANDQPETMLHHRPEGNGQLPMDLMLGSPVSSPCS